MDRYGNVSKERGTTKLNRFNKEIEKYETNSNKAKEYIDKKLLKVQGEGYFKDYWKKVNKIIDEGGSYLDLESELSLDFDKAYKEGGKVYKELEQITNKGERYIENTMKLNKTLKNKERLISKTPGVKEELGNKLKDKESKVVKSKKVKESGVNVRRKGVVTGLDKWLQTYKVNLTNHYKQRYERGYIKGYEYNEQISKIDKYVEMQKETLLKRAYSVVGEIKGIEFGGIGADGSFNGLVIGEKGKATIYTSLAGGTVQRLHYRVYVKKI